MGSCTQQHIVQSPVWERHFDKAFERASGSHDQSLFLVVFFTVNDTLLHNTLVSNSSFDLCEETSETVRESDNIWTVYRMYSK